MSLIMGVTGHKQCEFFGVFDLVYTLVSTCIYDANLKIFMFEPKGLRTSKLCMNQHLVDIYKFCTQDAPGLISLQGLSWDLDICM